MTILRRVVVTAAVVVAVAAATAGARYAWVGRSPRIPVLDCPSVIDLGERDVGEIATGRFRVANTGRSELQLAQFRTSCSCAGVEIEEDGQLRRVLQVNIPPGGSADLSVRVAVGARPGTPQLVLVQFETNDPVRPVGTLEVIVPRVKGGAYADPTAVVFGIIPRGAEARQIVRLYDNGVSGRRIEQVRSTHPDQFEVRLLPTSEGGEPELHETAGRLFARLEVIALTERAGRLDGEIKVRLAGEQLPQAGIPVLGEVTSAVTCSPSVLVLPCTVEGRIVYAGEVLVVSRDGEPLRVELESIPDGLSAVVNPVPGHPDQLLLRVECPATKSAASRVSQVRLRASPGSGRDEPLEIPVTHPRGEP